MMSNPLVRVLLTVWLPIVVALTVVIGLVYGAVQQNYRQSANDPQIQLAQDIADAINGGVDPKSLVGTGKIDMAKSLATWLMVVDKNNKVVTDNVVLNAKTPTFPAGVLDVARQNGQNNVTWQPQAGVRSATVSVKVSNSSGQVVVIGRSLKEVESRVSKLTLMSALAWVFGVVVTFVTVWFGYMITKKAS